MGEYSTDSSTEHTRKCNVCNEVKPISKFGTNTFKNGGKGTYRTCRKCREIIASKKPNKVRIDNFVRKSMHGLGPRDY